MRKGRIAWICIPALLAALLLWGILPSTERPAESQPGERTGKVEGQFWAETGPDEGDSGEESEGDGEGAGDEIQDDTQEEPSLILPQENVLIRQQVSWEAINSFPIKSADMTIDDARQLCVEFLRFAKTALWTPKETVEYIRNSGGSTDTMWKGVIYGGLPYVGVASGSVYRLMDFIDEATGEVDISKALTDDNGLSGVVTMDRLKYFGNQCSIGAYWGWGRAINHAQYRWTHDMIEAKGFYRLGPYTYDDTKGNWSDNNTTITVCNDNGEQILYQSYAQFKPADGMVHYTSGGHVIMCASEAHVEYLENGDIDGDNSFITILDQAQTWKDRESSAGDKYRGKNCLDEKRTFRQLLEGYYVPFTFAEWLGTDPIEDTVCSFSHVGSTVTPSQLFAARVTCNYGISDVYVIVRDNNGEEIYRHAVRSGQAGLKEISVAASGKNVDTWGSFLVGTYPVEIMVQLGTGERPTIYLGTLLSG